MDEHGRCLVLGAAGGDDADLCSCALWLTERAAGFFFLCVRKGGIRWGEEKRLCKQRRAMRRVGMSTLSCLQLHKVGRERDHVLLTYTAHGMPLATISLSVFVWCGVCCCQSDPKPACRLFFVTHLTMLNLCAMAWWWSHFE